jgi:hypothetical protein
MTPTRRLHESSVAKAPRVARFTGAVLGGAVALCTAAVAAAALAVGLPPELGLLAGFTAWRLLRAPRSAAAPAA